MILLNRKTVFSTALVLVAIYGVWFLNQRAIESDAFDLAQKCINMEVAIFNSDSKAAEIEQLHASALGMRTNSPATEQLKNDLVRLTETEAQQVYHPILSIGSTLQVPTLLNKIADEAFQATNRHLVIPSGAKKIMDLYKHAGT
ncbi:MAG: hypothetical protein ACXVC1_07515 [Tumebacillaceae bacterium]